MIVDVGTTALAAARALVARTELKDVVVFTNGLKTALELEPAIPRLTVVVLGGTLRPLQHSLVEPLATHVIEQIAVSTLLLGCNGIHPAAGVTNINLPEAHVKRQMLKIARRRIVLADGGKVGRTELAHLCPVEEINYLAGPGRGVILIKLTSDDDRVLGFVASRGDRDLLTVETSRGAEQTISTAKYEVTGRGGRGRELLQRGQFVRVVPAAPEVPQLEQL